MSPKSILKAKVAKHSLSAGKFKAKSVAFADADKLHPGDEGWPRQPLGRRSESLNQLKLGSGNTRSFQLSPFRSNPSRRPHWMTMAPGYDPRDPDPRGAASRPHAGALIGLPLPYSVPPSPWPCELLDEEMAASSAGRPRRQRSCANADLMGWPAQSCQYSHAAPEPEQAASGWGWATRTFQGFFDWNYPSNDNHVHSAYSPTAYASYEAPTFCRSGDIRGYGSSSPDMPDCSSPCIPIDWETRMERGRKVVRLWRRGRLSLAKDATLVEEYMIPYLVHSKSPADHALLCSIRKYRLKSSPSQGARPHPPRHLHRTLRGVSDQRKEAKSHRGPCDDHNSTTALRRNGSHCIDRSLSPPSDEEYDASDDSSLHSDDETLSPVHSAERLASSRYPSIPPRTKNTLRDLKEKEACGKLAAKREVRRGLSPQETMDPSTGPEHGDFQSKNPCWKLPRWKLAAKLKGMPKNSK